MPLYVVTYTHPDAEGWAAQLLPHIHYLQDLLATGELKASDPLPGAAPHAAPLILEATNRAALDAIIARDSFAEHNLIAEMTVAEWDPIFGAFNALSSRPGQLQSS